MKRGEEQGRREKERSGVKRGEEQGRREKEREEEWREERIEEEGQVIMDLLS